MSTSRAGNAAAAERLRLLRAVLAERGLTGSAAGAQNTTVQARSPMAVVPYLQRSGGCGSRKPFFPTRVPTTCRSVSELMDRSMSARCVGVLASWSNGTPFCGRVAGMALMAS